MKYRLRIGIGAVLMGLVAGCDTMPETGAPDPLQRSVGLKDETAFLGALEDRIFSLIAASRRIDLPDAKELKRDPQLTEIARLRSAKMAEDGSFADKGGNRHVSASLLMERDAQFQGMVGENVAALLLPQERPIDIQALAVRFVIDWVTSEQHRENLMFAAYDRSGVGAARKGDVIYVTQLFSAKLRPGTDTSASRSQVPQLANPSGGKDD